MDMARMLEYTHCIKAIAIENMKPGQAVCLVKKKWWQKLPRARLAKAIEIKKLKA